MRRIDEFIEGLQILSKYDTKGYGLQAEHDQLYSTVKQEPTPDECARLIELGWSPAGEDNLWWVKTT